MSIKIVAFGESEQVAKFLEKSRGGHSLQSQEAITVENITVADSHFLIFAVRQRGLVSEQATGTNGLLFFLGGQTPLFQEKQYLNDLLSSKVQFEGVPVAVLFERGQQLTLKDVVNYMELYRLKDRASMIKQISWSEDQWISQVYGWVKVQSDQSKGRGFQAAPKVVKLKAKYRQSVEEQSQKKYEGLVNDKQVRVMGVKQQQQIYIQREKQKLKHQNMETQLANFSRNKKKMSPYDIKPTPNPKIQPNLHFFLKDPNSQPPPQVSIKIQTDQFKDRPAPPPYKPKKTGINTATQIQQNQLFSFDKEVKPILAILTTKALQTAALQIQQEEELLKMAKYKSAYEQRVRKQKEHQQKNIDEELRIIKEKDKLLEEHRQRAQTRKNIQNRVQCYQFAHKLLQNIYFQSTNKLINANAYPDSLSNFLSSEYLEDIIGKAAVSYHKIVHSQNAIKGIFEKDVVGSIKDVATGAKQARQKTKKKLQARLINRTQTARKIHILYKHDHPQFSNFSKYLTKHFDNTFDDYVKTRQEQIQQATDRLHGGQITDEDLLKVKLKDSVDYGAAGHQCYLLNNRKQICFTSTSNRYQKIKQNFISNGLILFDKEGQILEEITFGKVDPKLDYLKDETNLRDLRESLNMDDGIVINLAKVPEKIKCIVLVSRITDVQRFRGEGEAKKIKYASYGVEFWEHKIPIHNKNIGESIKWEEIIKVQEGEQPPSQNLIIVSYVLRRRVLPDYWTLQDVSYVPQPYKNEGQLEHFLDQLSKFYYRSNEYLKEQEQQQKIQRPPSSGPQRKGSPAVRSKSKKVIQEPKKKTVLKVSTKILNQVNVELNQQFQQTFRKLKGSVDEWKEFTQGCQNGWHLLIKGKQLESTDQLSKYRKIGDLVLKKVPKIQQPKIQKIEENEGEKQAVQQ